MADFSKVYVPRAGDITVRMLRPDRYEVSVFDATRSEWIDDKIISLPQLNKDVRSRATLIGEHNNWEYYRAGGTR